MKGRIAWTVFSIKWGALFIHMLALTFAYFSPVSHCLDMCKFTLHLMENALQLSVWLFSFFCQPFQGLRNYNQYPWFRKSLNILSQSNDFIFFWSIHVIIDIKIGIFISKRPMTTTFDKQVHLEELNQMRLTSKPRAKLNTLHLECLSPPNLTGW